MGAVCDVCGTTNGAGARFCSECGSPMARPDAPQQRKTVTVVFSDLVGSTSMAEELDPEALSAILAAYFGSMRAILERHGGTVEKYIGDAVVAVFGIPVLHEDDAQRAVRAALEMRAALEALAADLDQRHGVRLKARIGVNTGQVVVGAPGTSGSLALGHPMNMAARLQQAAGTGEIIVGEDTYRLLPGSFQVEAVGSIAVKDSTEPIRAWRITGIVEEPVQAWQAKDTFVGRRPELDALDTALAVATRDSVCATVTVLAPPGNGKSRLAAEWSSTARTRATVLIGRSRPYGETITYAPLVDIVRQLEDERGATALETILASAPDGAEVRRSVASTVRAASHGSPPETGWAFRRLFEVLATDRPLVVMLEDLHWADALMLDLVEYIATTSSGHPILLVCLARPELLESRPAWSDLPNAVQVRLDALTPSETDALLARLDTAEALDPDVRRRIVEAAGGVPLFVEQMVALGVDAGSAPDDVVPPTIRALLAARVDRLGPGERTVLDRAAIIGEAFEISMLAELMPESRRADLDSLLATLGRAELVRHEAPPSTERTFRFSHAMVRDAVHDAMSRTVRSDLHQRLAELLQRTSGTAQEVIGHHLEAAYRERLELGLRDAASATLAIRAGSALLAAGRRAAAREETRHAVALFTRAAELVRHVPATLVTVLPDLIGALVALPDLEAADRVHEEAVDASRALADRTSELRAEVAWSRAGYLRDVDGWTDRCQRIANEAVDHFGPLADDANLARAWLLAASAIMAQDFEAAIDCLRRAELHARRAEDERAQIMVWDELGGAMLIGRTPYPEVLGFTRREIAWARERGIAFTEADGMLGEAYGLAASGDFDAARRSLVHVRMLFAELPGVVAQHGESYTLGGSIELDDGDPAAAEAQYRRALELFELAGNRRWGRNAAIGLIHALLDRGAFDEAAAVIDTTASQSSTANVRSDSSLLGARARLAARRGEPATAVSLARGGVDHVAGSSFIQTEARAREILAGMLEAAGEPILARRELEQAAALYAEKAYRPGSLRVAQRLASS